jgi:hypothetical protein
LFLVALALVPYKKCMHIARARWLPASVASLVAAGALGLSALPASPAIAVTAFVPGTGTSSAGVARIQLRSSGAAIGFGLGVARTRFAGAQGNAEAASVDLGLVDTVAKAPLACGYSPNAIIPPGVVPAKVAVSSGDGATERRTASAGAGGPLQLGSQYGAAAPDASAAAIVDGVSLDLPGVLRLVGGTASSTARLVPGSQRQSSADSALSGLSLAGGLVQLDGLRWTAIHRTGAQSGADAGFSVASMRVGGQALPTAGPAQLKAAVAAANAALAPVGLFLGLPEVTPGAAGTAVGPLRLSVSATPPVRAALNAALAAIQPLRTQLLALAAPLQVGQGCGVSTALGLGYLGVDLVTLVLGEQGAIDLDLGGAAAGTAATTFANPFDTALGLVAAAARPPGTGAPPGAASSVGTPLSQGPLPAPPAAPPDRAGTSGQAVAAAPNGPALAPVPLAPVSLAPVSVSCRSVHGGSCTGDHGPLVGWLVVCLIAVLAAADRLRARRS